jgi:hypothetical protein
MLSQELSESVVESLTQWNQGQQEAAVERIKPFADKGEPAALVLISWFLAQMGQPRIADGIPYAEAAIKKGIPFIVNYYVPHMMNDQVQRPNTPNLVKPAVEAGFSLDPMGWVQAAIQQNDRGTAAALVDAAAAPQPYPHAWNEFLEEARRDFQELSTAVGAVKAKRDEALGVIEGNSAAIKERREEIENRASQLLTLIGEITSAQTQSFFDAEAKRNEEESRSLWKWGIGVLAAAAALAILPLTVYFAGVVLNQNWLKDQDLTAAHFAPAVALGAVAGVLLARSRGRDRARQRARDLSVALQTMFAYSGQITDQDERQRFLHDMGRVVIEAFLRNDSPLTDAGGDSVLQALRRG